MINTQEKDSYIVEAILGVLVVAPCSYLVVAVLAHWITQLV